MPLPISAFAWLPVIAAVALAGAAAPDASAQSFPTKTITVLWPFTPGSAGETMTRALAQEASKSLGRPVVLEAKPGAGGKIAFSAVLNGERGDGHLLALMNAAPVIILPLASTAPRPLPGKEYTPITFLFDGKQVLYASASLPFRDLKGMIAYAKANPGKLNYGSTGVGGVSHLSTELLKSLAGIDLTHVPYKGAAEAIPALLRGDIQILATSGDPKRYVDAGQLIVLGATSFEPWSLFPSVRPIGDTVPGYGFATWYGLIAPAGVQPSVVAKLHGAFNQAMRANLEQVKISAGIGGLDLMPGRSPEEFSKRIMDDFVLLEPVVQKAGIKQ